MPNVTGFTPGWLFGGAPITNNTPAYVNGCVNRISTARAYTFSANSTSGLKHSYLYGRIANASTGNGYLAGTGSNKSSIHSFMYGPEARSSLHVGGMEGATMEVAFIELKTSDAGVTLNKKFRVLAEGYDDGTGEKAESMERTIGGGLDYNAGAIYNSWNPIIRVRHTEDETGYGTLAELRQFYNYNNPNGTPSNKITFVDHHQEERTVFIVGTFQKAMMGCKIEGNQAWFVVRLRLVEVIL